MKKLLLLFLLIYHVTSIAQNAFSVLLGDTLKFQSTIENHLVTDQKNGSSSGYIAIRVDAGTLNDGEYPHYDFTLLNNSETPLIIDEAYWGEPIFSPSYPKEPIMKGKKAIVRYTCRADHRPGAFSKSALVRTNFGQISIVFTGLILPPGIYTDKHFDVCQLGENEQLNLQFRIYNRADSTLKIASVKTDPEFTVSYDSTEAGFDKTGISAGSYRTFNLSFVPAFSGDYASPVTITIGWWKIQYNLFTTVTEPAKRKSTPANKPASAKHKRSG